MGHQGLGETCISRSFLYWKLPSEIEHHWK